MSVEIIPAAKSQKLARKSARRRSQDSNAIESIVLRIDAIRENTERRPYVLGVAGCSDKDAGKIAANFAASSAELNMGRVVLVQCKRVRNAKKAGFIEFIHGDSVLEDLVEASDVVGLDLLALGVEDDRRLAPDLIASAVKELRSNYDLVVMQLPPIDGTPGSLAFNRVVDSVAIVVRAGKTRARDAERALQILEDDGVEVAGMILNGARPSLPKWMDRWF
jgi:Mrp family chromosome partitioning ATPase